MGAALCALFVCWATSAAALLCWAPGANRRACAVLGGRGARVLLVIAHPDDESMFFAPAVAALACGGVSVHVLCLSTGDAAGLGATRARELPAACAVLGVPQSHVQVLDLAQLQDGMKQRWPSETVQRQVDDAVRSTRASAVLTFDARGVSGHPNHVDTHVGVLAWAAAQQQGAAVECWLLESPSFATKFTGTLLAPLKALATACSGGTRACFLMPSLGLARRALAQHRSQHVWFRSLFVAFASCAFANTLMRAEHTRSQTRRLKG